jgi:hypothetical protein
MALVGAYDEESRKSNVYADPGYQRYLKWLQETVDGEPGRSRANSQPFEVVEKTELVDGPVVAPPPARSKRKRRRVRQSTEAIIPGASRTDKRLVRRLKGEP